ncbi:hypothetical protein [Terrisporobacter vanillatitrophus]|uniref:hypothetical protein n=1 Tax=Terrisporobacter vanillatitrophus TaxID=3058402 RepID=UPI003366B049
MEIKYSNCREYYIKGYEKYRKRSVKANAMLYITSMAVILFLSLYYLYKLSDFYNIGIKFYLEPVLIISVLSITITILLNKLSKKSIDKLIDKLMELGTSTFGEKTIEVVEDKIIYDGESQHTEYNIKAFDNIYEECDVIVICIQKFNPIIIIPTSAFHNEIEKSKFINLIKEKSNYIK